MDLKSFYKNKFGIRSGEILEILADVSEVHTVRKGQKITRRGDQQKNVILLYRGITRGYITGPEGEEVTTCIAMESGDVLMTSMDLKEPATCDLDALEECVLVELPISILAQLVTTYPEVAVAYNEQIVKWGNFHLTSKTELCHGNATHRYRWFCQTYPGLIERVNNRYIASFLGMTPVTLSRLRHGVATKKREEESVGP
ncbi:MAG: Crp/Fnr family transcriptional regulator [Gemmiger sp.]|uniref:Crp/Fnr family transcriptional regulator n=1 Tax=Gemmiger sp. TaxID=2049027 RepID=UPI002E75B785|nr:Crp/Fnr family transcriptional regulator [Gemmiger sp.]MEE0799752.1 Crp/Fnr family transcriptional regulator [Gemmiger sp.]